MIILVTSNNLVEGICDIQEIVDFHDSQELNEVILEVYCHINNIIESCLEFLDNYAGGKNVNG